MAERRSLTAAVASTTPNVEPDVMRSFVTQNQNHERPVTSPVEIVEKKQTKPRESTPATAEPKTLPAKRKPSRFQPVGLIPVTVRLKPEIAGALKRASLERELDGEEVFTQQDLVEQALEPWLKDQGYIG